MPEAQGGGAEAAADGAAGGRRGQGERDHRAVQAAGRPEQGAGEGDQGAQGKGDQPDHMMAPVSPSTTTTTGSLSIAV